MVHNDRSRAIARTEDTLNRRDDIIATTAKLFAEYGFHNTSMREISIAAGVSKATLYHYFVAKEDLLQSVLENGIRVLLAAAEQALDAEGADARMRALLRTHAEHVSANLADLKVFLFEQRVIEGQAEKFVEYRKLRRRYDAIYVEVITQGQAEGLFRAGSPKLIANGMLGIYNWMVQWYRPQRAKELQTIVPLFEKMAMAALRAPQADPDDGRGVGRRDQRRQGERRDRPNR